MVDPSEAVESKQLVEGDGKLDKDQVEKHYPQNLSFTTTRMFQKIFGVKTRRSGPCWAVIIMQSQVSDGLGSSDQFLRDRFSCIIAMLKCDGRISRTTWQGTKSPSCSASTYMSSSM